MDSYGLTMKGDFVSEEVATLPSWTSSDKGREVYITSTGQKYFGGPSGWIEYRPQFSYTVDSSKSDQGAAGGGSGLTVYDIINTVGTSKTVTICFPHNPANGNTTTYTWDTSLSLASYPNIYLLVDPGSIFERNTGDEVFTIYSPENIFSSQHQKIASDDLIRFSFGGTVYPQWWGALGDSSHDDSTAIQFAINSLNCSSVSGGEIRFKPGQYNLYTTGVTAATNGIKLRADSPRFVGSSAFGAEILYSGNSNAVTFGVSGTINYRCGFDKIQIRATGGATTSGTAVGLKLVNQHYFESDEAAIKDFTLGTGLLFEPAGALMFGATSQFRAMLIHQCFYGVHSNGTDSFVKDNHTIFYGGAVIGDDSTGSIGIYLNQYSDGYIFYGTDVESYDYGYYIAGISHRSIGARSEFCRTTAVYLTATSQKCAFLEHQFGGGGTQWIDNGTSNIKFSYGDYFGKLQLTSTTNGSEAFHVRNSSETSLVNVTTAQGDPKLMLGNSCGLEIYTDNYVTQKFRVVGSTGAVQIGGNAASGIVRHLSGFGTWNPASIAAGGTETTTITVTGATTGGNIPTVVVGADQSLQGLILTGYVSASNTVTLVLFNPTSGAVDLPLLYVRADVWEH